MNVSPYVLCDYGSLQVWRLLGHAGKRWMGMGTGVADGCLSCYRMQIRGSCFLT